MAREQRKTVTVLFCDLAGSTALGESVDPERLRALLATYFERMKGIVEYHGGGVEKFIGDAVMATFGVPSVHEDDALRAVRAAVQMRDAFPQLGLEGRIGVMTGEVVTGTEERLATGDAVNVAARLEQAAAPGEVLIGESTLALVREAVETEPVDLLVLKGKAEPVAAHRLLQVTEAPERLHDTPFVGREQEVRLLGEAWQRACGERRCELVTVVGEAGVGKSRLAAEALASVDATIVRGRCLPYGDGITYWPVVEVLKQLHFLPADEAAATAIRSLLGESGARTSADEIAWAFRKTLEDAATIRPLVVVFDDLQWGVETLHDLVEHVALLSTGAPILLLCMARPELVERRPTWPVALTLEPLDDDAVATLIGDRVSGAVRDRITRAAGGNPLFVSEMLVIAGSADGEVSVPPTLRALLSARLDQLDPAERGVLERGAVEGEIFHSGAVQALSPEGMQVMPHLAALVRRRLIRPNRPQLAGQDAFRFRHLLIRDVAYDALTKSIRAGLHERYASWLEGHGTELVELDEIVGYHLEQACRYLGEIGTPNDGTLTARGRRRLSAAGHRAALHQDYRAAASLFERAAALVPPGEFDLGLENELGEALLWAGRGGDALRRADALAERAAATGDRIAELCGRLRAGTASLELEPDGARESLAALVEEALPVLEAAGDDVALYIAYSALGVVADTRGRKDAALEAYEQAFVHAARAGHATGWVLAARASCRFFGTTPVTEMLAWLDANEPDEGRDYFFRAYRANSLAMLGRFDEARAILAQDRAEQAARGGGILLANLTAFESTWVELWAGDPATAAEFAADGWRLHREQGNEGFLAHAAGTLAEALYALDRVEDADLWAERAVEGARDVWGEAVWRKVKAKVLARRGRHADAERLIGEAVAMSDATDMLDFQGDVYADLAEVLLLGDKANEAIAALEQALERYDRKGNVVCSERVRAQLAALDTVAAR
jgi:class 3 adenylate cyclase/tetratricopeptide (TPR) repeat protein